MRKFLLIGTFVIGGMCMREMPIFELLAKRHPCEAMLCGEGTSGCMAPCQCNSLITGQCVIY